MKIMAITLITALTLGITACKGNPDSDDSIVADIEGAEKLTISAETGDVIQFGGFDWRVLDIQDGKALVLSDKIVGEHLFDSSENPVTWEDSELREYLGTVFYNDTFSAEEKELIDEITNHTAPNPWYGYEAAEGIDTVDKVFLLSIYEVIKYFGESGAVDNPPEPEGSPLIEDEFNADRIATHNSSDKATWWWTRSPGRGRRTIYVGDRGFIAVIGTHIDNEHGGIRPAFWLILDSE